MEGSSNTNTACDHLRACKMGGNLLGDHIYIGQLDICQGYV